MVEKYLIADFLLEINYTGDCVVREKLSDYKVDIEKTAVKIVVGIEYTTDDISVKSENITKISDNGYFYSTKCSDVLFYYDENVSKVIAKIEYSKDYTNVNISIFELKKVMGVEDSQLTYNILGLAFNYVVNMHGCFVFHSSSLCYNGCGVAFSAKSGTGKSTHTNLWLKNFEDCFILNDDTPLISKGKDGSYYISGTPWAGTTGINRNVNVPLKALVLLERGSNNRIEQISPAHALNFLFDGIRSPLNGLMLSNILDTFNLILSEVPVYHLKCNMESEAALISQKTIYGR